MKPVMITGLFVSVAVAIGAIDAALRVAPGHTLGHINCPPGSHGKPRFDGAGQRLQAARNSRPVADRAVTSVVRP
jgi:hypothetical protein